MKEKRARKVKDKLFCAKDPLPTNVLLKNIVD